mmetsp:Transcript_21789/g.47555  ORF Transcript_21789/g.47555 Transcript_21789/m.47555 type:complete len:1001 (+) Transcript_21789:167-3169(+)|eukprot:CAMPEP_0178483970 /NCGR_PEP_ID=MMETSP0696-20121128/7508_1 /TAXON_ID=265572 /ORGANISM="Extubocellulus spinifer, Strain CCMP396" /LENGTH=1000 /DNA_ID=CAMNT_0020111503 /DNA_START=137 /DNA_END=3139 /DNA_ORIENTATION=-
MRFSSSRAKAGLAALSLFISILILHPGIRNIRAAADATDDQEDTDQTAKISLDKVSKDNPYWKQFIDKTGLSSKPDQEDKVGSDRKLFPGQVFPTDSPSDSPSTKPSVSFGPSSSPSESFMPSVSSIPSSSPSLSFMPSESSSPSSSPSDSPICTQCGIELKTGEELKESQFPYQEALLALRKARDELYCNLVEGFCPVLIENPSVCLFIFTRGCVNLIDGNTELCKEIRNEDDDPECRFNCADVEACGPDHPLAQCQPDNYIEDEWNEFLAIIDANIEELERLACGEKKAAACSTVEEEDAEDETCPFECVTEMPTTQPSEQPSSTPSMGTLNRVDKIPRQFRGGGKLAIASNDRKNSLDYLSKFSLVSTYEFLILLFQALLDATPECIDDFLGIAEATCVTATNLSKLIFSGIVIVFSGLWLDAKKDLDKTDYENEEILFNYQQINYDNGQFANEKLNEIICPYGPDGPDFITRGQGCDGVDQNCDCIVDDCLEDKIPPTITLEFRAGSKRRLKPQASLKSVTADADSIGPIAGDPLAVSIPFPSFEEGEQFLIDNVLVSDDCASGLIKEVAFFGGDGDEENCTLCEFSVTATDTRCAVESGAAKATQNYILEIDRTPAPITCGFFTPQNRWHVNPQDFPLFDPNVCNATVPFPEPGDILHVDRADFDGKEMININFWYTIENPKSLADDPIDVTVTLSSNEVEFDIKSTDEQLTEMGRIVRSRYIKPTQVERASIYLSPTTCHDKDDENKICEIDPDSETRVYEIKIETVDISLNRAEAMCNVIVIPDCHYRNETTRSSKSSRSYYGSDVEYDDDDGDGSVYEDYYTPKSSKSSKGCKPHDPNDLRDWFNSTACEPRHVISELKYQWDPTLEQILKPPEPEPICGSKGSKGSSRSRSFKGSKGCPCPGKGKGSCSKGSKGCSSDPYDTYYDEDWEYDDEGDVEVVESDESLGTSSALVPDLLKLPRIEDASTSIHTDEKVDKKGKSEKGRRKLAYDG